VGLAGEPADAVHDSLTHAGDMTRQWIAGMDFGFRSDTAILFARERDDGALVIEHEFVARERVLERHIETVKEFMRERGGIGALKWLAADPSGNNRNEQTGEANIALMRGAKIPARGRKMSNVDGFRLVRARLAPADGPVRLFIHARCTRLIESLRRYHFKPGTDGRCQEPAKGQWDHACDALRYLITTLDGAPDAVSSEW
jgi:phage terminase large subunit